MTHEFFAGILSLALVALALVYLLGFLHGRSSGKAETLDLLGARVDQAYHKGAQNAKELMVHGGQIFSDGVNNAVNNAPE